MTAREELAQSIATNLDRTFGAREFGPATQDYALADALLAEGWGKLADAWDEGYTTGNAHNGRRDASPVQEPAMSRPQNATVSAPESRVSARMWLWRTGGTIGAQNGTGRLKGTCKLCREPMEFIRGRFWVHEGGGYLVHSRMVEAERSAAG